VRCQQLACAQQAGSRRWQPQGGLTELVRRIVEAFDRLRGSDDRIKGSTRGVHKLLP